MTQDQPISQTAQAHVQTALSRLHRAIELLEQGTCNHQSLQQAAGNVIRAATAMKRACAEENAAKS